VSIAKVFANKAAKLGYDAKAVGEHGTHVAGTVACDANTTASIDGATIPYAVSGVAPGAQLGSYNVFPGDIEDARSEDILNALDAAALDGMDVINMSLGGGSKGVQDLLMHAVNNLDQAGIVVAVSAGNEGPGHGTIGSPGAAERALTAGASSVGHYLAVPVTTAGAEKLYTNGDGDFPVTKDVTGQLVASTVQSGETTPNAGLGIGCTDASIPADLRNGSSSLSEIAKENSASDPSSLVVPKLLTPSTLPQLSSSGQPELPRAMAAVWSTVSTSRLARAPEMNPRLFTGGWGRNKSLRSSPWARSTFI